MRLTAGSSCNKTYTNHVVRLHAGRDDGTLDQELVLAFYIERGILFHGL